MEFALAGFFLAFTGAGIAGILLLALLMGLAVASIFGAIFFGMNRLGKRVARRHTAAGQMRLEN